MYQTIYSGKHWKFIYDKLKENFPEMIQNYEIDVCHNHGIMAKLPTSRDIHRINIIICGLMTHFEK